MPDYNAASFASCVILGIGVAVVVYALLNKSLRRLLDSVIEIPDGTDFYLRVLSLVLFLVALSGMISNVRQKPDAHFIEYVWGIASELSGVFQNLFIVLLVYAGLITLLVAFMRPKNGK